ncbi:MAG: transcription termination factor Rho [Actinobacteria bacterium]|nr:MAG: transcription termination factor Rho [Actinomycetota bacterium]
MSVLDRSALEASPLADLHAIASELGLDGFRRLRKAELIDAILARQSGAEEDTEAPDEADVAPAEADVVPAAEKEDEREEAPAARRRRSRRGGRGRARADERPAPAAAPAEDEEEADAGDREVEGVVELLANGSGFVRVSPPEPSDDDVYVSAAQVRRCELVSGDTIAGPVRRPRRSERYPSLIRVDTINGRPADEVAEGTRYDDLPAAFPSERIELGGDDPTLKAIEWLTPFGKGSRVTIAGPARAGKTEALRRLAGALAEREGLVVSVALAGVRPEEITEWSAGPVPVAASAGLSASVDAQGQAVEHAVEQARRMAARGGDAVVLVDSLDGVAPSTARRALAGARDIVDGGSLTVIATAARPLGGETTVIVLDARLAGARRFPALDVLASGTLRPELLVGEAGAEALAQARAEALEERAR